MTAFDVTNLINMQETNETTNDGIYMYVYEEMKKKRIDE